MHGHVFVMSIMEGEEHSPEEAGLLPRNSSFGIPHYTSELLVLNIHNINKQGILKFEPVHEKTNNLGFRPGPTQTGLYKLRKEPEA